MGRLFLEHLGGKRIFMCDSCQTYLTNRHEILSTHFRGATGAAYLFRKVVNIRMANVEERNMMTGKHLVRDVFCKNCNIKIGWMYEYAVDADQVYKEGCVILERKLLREVEEPNNSLAERWHSLTRTQSTSSVSSSGISSITIT